MEKIQKEIDSLLTQIKEEDFLNNKSILMEQSKSQSCTRQDAEVYRIMFSVNPSVKNTYKRGINSIIKRVFSDKYFYVDPTGKGQMPGVYYLESDDRSVINKLNTNYYCFCILVKDINRVLMNQGLEPINFVGVKPREQEEMTQRFVKYIDKFSERIFTNSSHTFQNLMKTLGMTHSLGEKREFDSTKKLKEKFGEENVVKIGGLGSREDMISGVDVIIKVDGKEYQAQIKPINKLIYNDGNITATETGNVKKYKTDWLIFTNRTNTYVFDNKNTQIIDGNYVFPESALIYSL